MQVYDKRDNGVPDYLEILDQSRVFNILSVSVAATYESVAIKLVENLKYTGNHGPHLYFVYLFQ